MRKSKTFKIIISIALVYLVGSFIFIVVGLYNDVNAEYSEQTYDYTRAKFCYECARGEKDGICPKINKKEEVEISYPNAKEYEKYNDGRSVNMYRMGVEQKRKLKSYKINENLIIQNDYCYPSDWTDNAKYLSDSVFQPNKSAIYFRELTDPEFYFLSVFKTVGLPFYVLVCVAGGGCGS